MSQCSTATRGGKRSRKMKGGMGYGYDGGVISPGNIIYGAANTSVAMTPSGGVDTKYAGMYGDEQNATGGGRKSRKSRKTKKSRKTRKTRKTRGRRMRGGMHGAPGVVNAGAVGYGYSAPDGGVHGGIAPVAGYNAKMGGAPMNEAGVRSA